MPNETWKCVGDMLLLALEEAEKDAEAVSEADLLELGFQPTQAWVLDDLVVFVHDGKLDDVGLR